MIDEPLLRVMFACRGSTREGLGHVMRSRSVAAEMARLSSTRVCVVGEPYVETLVSGRGLHFQMLKEESELIKQTEAFQPHVVVFDALNFEPRTLARIREKAMTVSLSPVFNLLNEMDLVFHRTKYLGDEWIPSRRQGPEIRAGLQYAVIREQCVTIGPEAYRHSLEQQPLAIVISMGGADAGNKTLQTLRAIQSVHRPLLIWVLLGEGYGHSYEKLVDCVRQNRQHEIILAKTSDSMWRVMQNCSLAILAGGTITYEAAHAGLPSINVFEDGKHVFLIRELVEKGICLSAGFPMHDALDVVAANLSHLEKNREELWNMHQRATGQVNHSGAERIAKEIIEQYWERRGRYATPTLAKIKNGTAA